MTTCLHAIIRKKIEHENSITLRNFLYSHAMVNVAIRASLS
uniref:Uncharacterized protein n=1 Tax=Anguilla anguilla TaxID=7936 RepID=A0A0E9SW59_ANGAN